MTETETAATRDKADDARIFPQNPPAWVQKRLLRRRPPPRGDPQEVMSSTASSSAADVDVSASRSLSMSSTTLAAFSFLATSRQIATPCSTADSRSASAEYLHQESYYFNLRSETTMRGPWTSMLTYLKEL